MKIYHISIFIQKYFFLAFAIVIICLLFSILIFYWKYNKTLKTIRKNIAKRMIYVQKFLLILCLIFGAISYALFFHDLINLECKSDNYLNNYPSDSASASDYPSELFIDKPNFCIPHNKRIKMESDVLAFFIIFELTLICLIFFLFKNKSKIISGIEMIQIEEKKSQISSEVQNEGQGSQHNNISNFQVNQINNNNIPNVQSLDVNTQIIIENKPKKKRHKSAKAKV